MASFANRTMIIFSFENVEAAASRAIARKKDVAQTRIPMILNAVLGTKRKPAKNWVPAKPPLVIYIKIKYLKILNSFNNLIIRKIVN